MTKKNSIILTALVFIVAVGFFTTAFHLYNIIPHFDKFMHFIGGAIAAWFFVYYFRRDFRETDRWSKVRFILAIIGAVTFVGVVWEFGERLSTLYAPHWFRHYFYGGDLADTLTDILSDILGGVALAIGFKQKTSV